MCCRLGGRGDAAVARPVPTKRFDDVSVCLQYVLYAATSALGGAPGTRDDAAKAAEVQMRSKGGSGHPAELQHSYLDAIALESWPGGPPPRLGL